MTDTKFTPGPWEFSDNKCEPATDYSSNPYLYAKDGTIIAGCDEYFIFSDNPADNHLIAAAPNLYDKLEEALGEIELIYYSYNPVGRDKDDLSMAAKIIPEIKQALAKARGES